MADDKPVMGTSSNAFHAGPKAGRGQLQMEPPNVPRPTNDKGGMTMPIPRRWAILAFFVAVSAAVLGGVFVFGGSTTRRQEEREMSTTRISVDHVRRSTEKPFDEVTGAFERQLGRFEPGVYQTLAAGGNAEGAKAKIEAMAGPSGFMLFGTQDHGSLLRLAGQKRRVIQGRQPALRPPDDAARHPGESVRPAACPDLRRQRREDLRGVRPAVLPVRPVRE